MHGTIFSLLKRYVQTQYDHATWVRLVEAAGLTSGDFSHKEVYPDEHLYALVGQAAEATGIPAGELHEKFGEYLVPDLMYMYQRFVKPEWRTLDMLEHTEHSMHDQVRRVLGVLQHIEHSAHLVVHRVLDMLEHTEHSMHDQVRREHPENSPPVLHVQRLNENEVLIDYVSPRRMGGLAVGIVRGLANYFDEADRIDVMPTTSEEGERVQIHVRRS